MRHIILLFIAVLSMVIVAAAQDSIFSDIDRLLEEAIAALEDNDLQTAQTLLIGADTLITAQAQADCPSLVSVKALMMRALSTTTVEAAQPLISSARVLLADCLEEPTAGANSTDSTASGVFTASDGTFRIELPTEEWQVFDAEDGSVFFTNTPASERDTIIMRVMGPAFVDGPSRQFNLRRLSGNFTVESAAGSLGEMLGRPSQAFNALFGAAPEAQVIVQKTTVRQYEPRYGNLDDGRRWATIRFEFEVTPQENSGYNLLTLEGVVLILALDGGGYGAIRIYTLPDQFERLGDPLLDGLANSFSTRGLVQNSRPQPTARATAAAGTTSTSTPTATPTATPMSGPLVAATQAGASIPTFSRGDVASVATNILTGYLRQAYMRPASATWHQNNNSITPAFAAQLAQFWREHANGFDVDPVICAGADVSTVTAVGGAVVAGEAQFDIELGVSFGPGSSQTSIAGTVYLQYNAAKGWQISDVRCANGSSTGDSGEPLVIAPGLSGKQLVSAVYGWYIDRVTDFDFPPQDWYRTGPFTQRCIDELDAFYRRQSSDPRYNYDPFVMAQDVPPSFSVDLYTFSLPTNSIIYTVTLDFNPPLVLRVWVMPDGNGGYLIDKIWIP